ncbi:hypothetical protein PR202_gb12302 [Eleusine coracana subsp. coracana]|uniref:LOB domain-containing protein n=1 Tax=Eleusine coracana subsp. coracana TaxID=191504 RepID=A0AAV5EQP8_ELECO|nr:hypothetical protein PR202_gb12302 [Eleusine coracana subsp. coracana]
MMPDSRTWSRSSRPRAGAAAGAQATTRSWRRPRLSLARRGGPRRFRKQEASEAMSDSKGKGVMQWSGEACAACQHLHHACGPECVFAPHFPASEGPATFAMVDARFGADHVGLVLCSLSREQQAEAVREFVFEAQRPGAALVRPAAPPEGTRPPCAACKHLRQKCEPNCMYKPYFPVDSDPERFATAYAVYEAHKSVYEARRRQNDLVDGVPIFQTAVKMLEKLLAARDEEIARYTGEEAVSRPFVPAYEPEPQPPMTNEETVEVVTHQVMLQSAADAVAGVTDFVTPLHEELVKEMTPYAPGSSTGVTAAAVPGPAQSSTDIHMQQQPSQASTAAADVEDPDLPEGGDAADEPSQVL